ncbi:MAG: hypothetical protein AAB336_11990 [Acidobacteriota bacterium]
MTPLKCPQCNLTNFATAITCGRCGFLFQELKRPMPPIRAGENVANINSLPSVNVKAPSLPITPKPPDYSLTQVSQNTGANYQPSLVKTNLPPPQKPFATQSVNQQPPQNQFQPIGQSSNKASGVMSSTVERNTAMAEMALEANSGGVVFKILMLPFTVAKKIVGFLYSHKKVAALVLAPPAIAVVVGPNLLEAIKSANENSAVATIKAINQGQVTFMTTKFRCGELKELEQSQLIDASVGGGIKSGYVFTVSKLPGGCEVFAKPTETQGLSATGNRSFYFSTRDNTLRVSVDKNVLANGLSSAMDVGGDIKQPTEKPKIATAK